jgi:predicted nucleic acid-binding protein
VLDASVALKWLLPDRKGEESVERALTFLEQVRTSQVNVAQPPHWLAESATVVTRMRPDAALDDIVDLCEMDFEVVDNPDTYLRAGKLSTELSQHLFDTLYHAVALELPDAVLITADERYYSKAKSSGCILLLRNLGLSSPESRD